MRIKIVTVVWGREYVKSWLEHTVSSLLAPGNLPALSERNQIEYVLYTTKADLEHLTSDHRYKTLQEYASLQIEVISRGSNGKYATLTHFHELALRSAIGEKAATIFITPDSIWCDGTLDRIGALAEADIQAVLVDGIRVDARPFLKDLHSAIAPDTGSVSISGFELFALAAGHLHSYEIATMSGSRVIHDVPYTLHWPVPGQGLLTRGFCRFPVFLNTKVTDFELTGPIDQDLVQKTVLDQSKIHYSTGTDDIVVVSLDSFGASGACYKPTTKRGRLLTIARWASTGTTPQNWKSAEMPARYVYAEGDGAAWQRAEKLSRRELDEIKSLVKLIRLQRLLSENGANCAAAFLAYLLFEGELAGNLGQFPAGMFLIPNDETVLADEHDLAERLKLVSGKNAVKVLAKYFIPEVWEISALEHHLPDDVGIDRCVPFDDSLVVLIDSLV